MSENNVLVTFSIPLSLVELKKEADRIVEKDSGFKDFKESRDPRHTKKTKQNKLQSLKLNYYIYYYLTTKAKHLEGGENAKRSESKNNEEKDSE